MFEKSPHWNLYQLHIQKVHFFGLVRVDIHMYIHNEACAHVDV